MNFMFNQMNKLQKNRKNKNKGFTLVDLIIVIAIIAVLAAVLAPQYIKYVERSRYATDTNAFAEIAHAAEVAMVGDGTTTPTNSTMTVATTGASDYDDGPLATAVNAIAPEGKYTFVSKAYKDAVSIEITVSNGVASWTKPDATD